MNELLILITLLSFFSHDSFQIFVVFVFYSILLSVSRTTLTCMSDISSMVNLSPLGQLISDGLARSSYFVVIVLEQIIHMVLFGCKANYI
jgi:hypothetical protein